MKIGNQFNIVVFVGWSNMFGIVELFVMLVDSIVMFGFEVVFEGDIVWEIGIVGYLVFILVEIGV